MIHDTLYTRVSPEHRLENTPSAFSSFPTSLSESELISTFYHESPLAHYFKKELFMSNDANRRHGC